VIPRAQVAPTRDITVVHDVTDPRYDAALTAEFTLRSKTGASSEVSTISASESDGSDVEEEDKDIDVDASTDSEEGPPTKRTRNEAMDRRGGGDARPISDDHGYATASTSSNQNIASRFNAQRNQSSLTRAPIRGFSHTQEDDTGSGACSRSYPLYAERTQRTLQTDNRPHSADQSKLSSSYTGAQTKEIQKETELTSSSVSPSIDLSRLSSSTLKLLGLNRRDPGSPSDLSRSHPTTQPVVDASDELALTAIVYRLNEAAAKNKQRSICQPPQEWSGVDQEKESARGGLVGTRGGGDARPVEGERIIQIDGPMGDPDSSELGNSDAEDRDMSDVDESVADKTMTSSRTSVNQSHYSQYIGALLAGTSSQNNKESSEVAKATSIEGTSLHVEKTNDSVKMNNSGRLMSGDGKGKESELTVVNDHVTALKTLVVGDADLITLSSSEEDDERDSRTNTPVTASEVVPMKTLKLSNHVGHSTEVKLMKVISSENFHKGLSQLRNTIAGNKQGKHQPSESPGIVGVELPRVILSDVVKSGGAQLAQECDIKTCSRGVTKEFLPHTVSISNAAQNPISNSCNNATLGKLNVMNDCRDSFANQTELVKDIMSNPSSNVRTSSAANVKVQLGCNSLVKPVAADCGLNSSASLVINIVTQAKTSDSKVNADVQAETHIKSVVSFANNHESIDTGSSPKEPTIIPKTPAHSESVEMLDHNSVMSQNKDNASSRIGTIENNCTPTSDNSLNRLSNNTASVRAQSASTIVTVSSNVSSSINISHALPVGRLTAPLSCGSLPQVHQIASPRPTLTKPADLLVSFATSAGRPGTVESARATFRPANKTTELSVRSPVHSVTQQNQVQTVRAISTMAATLNQLRALTPSVSNIGTSSTFSSYRIMTPQPSLATAGQGQVLPRVAYLGSMSVNANDVRHVKQIIGSTTPIPSSFIRPATTPRPMFQLPSQPRLALTPLVTRVNLPISSFGGNQALIVQQQAIHQHLQQQTLQQQHQQQQTVQQQQQQTMQQLQQILDGKCSQPMIIRLDGLNVVGSQPLSSVCISASGGSHALNTITGVNSTVGSTLGTARINISPHGVVNISPKCGVTPPMVGGARNQAFKRPNESPEDAARAKRLMLDTKGIFSSLVNVGVGATGPPTGVHNTTTDGANPLQVKLFELLQKQQQLQLEDQQIQQKLEQQRQREKLIEEQRVKQQLQLKELQRKRDEQQQQAKLFEEQQRIKTQLYEQLKRQQERERQRHKYLEMKEKEERERKSQALHESEASSGSGATPSVLQALQQDNGAKIFNHVKVKCGRGRPRKIQPSDESNKYTADRNSNVSNNLDAAQDNKGRNGEGAARGLSQKSDNG